MLQRSCTYSWNDIVYPLATHKTIFPIYSNPVKQFTFQYQSNRKTKYALISIYFQIFANYLKVTIFTKSIMFDCLLVL